MFYQLPYFSRVASDPTTPAIPFDWKMAQEEVMRADLSNDPIQAAIARLERQVILTNPLFGVGVVHFFINNVFKFGSYILPLYYTINFESYHIQI